VANFFSNSKAFCSNREFFGGGLLTNAKCYFSTLSRFQTPLLKISIIPVTRKTKLLFPKKAASLGEIVIIQASLITKLPAIIK